MSYLEIKMGRSLDYVMHNDGAFTEVWELNAVIYHCTWFAGNTTNTPSIIQKHAN